MWTLGTSLLIPVILEAPMLVAIWTTGLASTITFGNGAIKNNTWMDGNYDWSPQMFKFKSGSLHPVSKAEQPRNLPLQITQFRQFPDNVGVRIHGTGMLASASHYI
jgi:hypothetical protein